MFCFIPTAVSVLSKRKAFSSENIRILFSATPYAFVMKQFCMLWCSILLNMKF